jgi:hypothetical protein
LAQLRKLDLCASNVTAKGLARLKGLTRLGTLDLSMCEEVRDPALAHLRGFAELRILNLRSTGVTDAGLVHLKGLGELRRLNLRGTKVGDAGLVHLGALTRLEDLDLRATGVTQAGIKKLNQTLPSARTVH